MDSMYDHLMSMGGLCFTSVRPRDNLMVFGYYHVQVCTRWVWAFFMETRVAMLSIVVEDMEHVETLNHLLHEYGAYIIGRMGIPYPKRGISLISVALDAPTEVISALSGKIGMIHGITAKAVYSKL